MREGLLMGLCEGACCCCLAAGFSIMAGAAIGEQGYSSPITLRDGKSW
jgi:hypothetical protein